MRVSSHVNTNALTLEEVVNKWIPYRLQAIESLQFAWEWINEPDSHHQVQVLVNGSIKIQGNVAGIANPMIEVGLIHARPLGRLKSCRLRRPLGPLHFPNSLPNNFCVW
jgi:hypothetical protein